MNVATIQGEAGEMTVYKTSKNKVSFADTSEKAKAITSSHMCGEVFNFLGLDDSNNAEFHLVPFASSSVEAFTFNTLDLEAIADNGIDELSAPAIATEETVNEPILETNNGEMTGAEVQESVQAEVAKAEEANPVLETETAGIPQRQAVSEDWMNN